MFFFITFNYQIQTGLVFDEKTSSCARQETLPETDPCRNYYNETTLDALKNGIFHSFSLLRNNSKSIFLLSLYKVITSDLHQTLILGQSQTGRLPAGVKSNGNGIKLDTR